MSSLRMAVVNVRALRRRLFGLLALVVIGVGICVAIFGVSQRARAASHDRIQEGIANRSIQLERLGDRDDTRALTDANLKAIGGLPGVAAVEPVAQASFGYKSAEVSGALLYATTPRPSLLPPLTRSVRRSVFPLHRGEAVLPETSGGERMRGVLGTDITIQVSRSTGTGTGVGVAKSLHVVGLYDPTWQVDGPDAAYVDQATVTAWAALRAGIDERQFRQAVGYDTATVVATSSAAVPDLLRRLQNNGYAASSLQQQLTSLPGVLGLIRVVGYVVLVSLVLLTGFSTYQVTAALSRQRRREIGILKAVGFTDRALFRMLTLEAAFLAVVGVAIGIVLSSIIGSIGNAALRSRGDLREYLRAGLVWPSPAIAAAALVVGALVVVCGALVPAVRAARLQPSDAIREW